MPPGLTRAMIEVHGEAGAEWLRRLPGQLTECAARWALTIGPPFVSLTYNYVAPAVRADGTRAVVKAGVPCRELTAEAEALRLFDGRGAVRILDADAGEGVLLLERLSPGAALLSVGDDGQAARVAARVMQALWRPAPDESVFPTVAEWFTGLARLRQRFGGGTGPLPPRLVEKAEALSAELTASAADSVLLHGDLHQSNILRARRAPWLAIDPKGVIGEPAFEPSAFLLNPAPQDAAVLLRRVAILAEMLGVSRERVRGWGLARAVLSACWSLEDHDAGWESAITVAERLAA